MSEESMHYDVVIVGAGPAGLAAAIRFKQRCQEHNKDYTVCILEKGSEVGAHILSGNVFDPKALNELFPDWEERGAPLDTPVTEDTFYFMTSRKAFRLPTPPQMRNEGNYVTSLANLCRWLAKEAEQLGIEIYPGFPAKEVIYNDQDEAIGIRTQEMGVDKQGKQTPQYQPGFAIYAKQLLLAEGCRGSVSQTVMQHYNLHVEGIPQTYGIGLKELWRIDPKKHKCGSVMHSIGWPLDRKTYGGSFIYHLEDNQVYAGYVVGLDYENTFLNPFKEFQRFKTHSHIQPLFEGGERIAYGARALNEGGWQALPELVFPGGMIIGCAAGFLNVPKIKGSHTAMKSGMLAAESAFDYLSKGNHDYQSAIESSWIADELQKVRNIRPGFRWGLLPGLLNAALETYVFRGYAPWTLKTHYDHLQTKSATDCKPIDYPKPDGKITFDILSSVYLANTSHQENQPCHLKLKDPAVAVDINWETYRSPETRYCPANVYEIVDEGTNGVRLQINAANCIHCKTCDIKDPTQNIVWTTPEGGSGPNYPNM